MTSQTLKICFLLLLILPGMSLRTWKRASLLGCHFGDCSMIVSALRDPRTIWNTGRFDKAMAHFQTMQELFAENNNIANAYKRRASRAKRHEANSPAKYLLFDI